MPIGDGPAERITAAKPGAGRLACAALVALVAAAAFATSLAGEFVWDDTAYLPPVPHLTAVRNPLVFFETSPWAFTTVRAPDVPLYRPLFTLAIWALAPVLGKAPAAWHAFAVSLHVLCSLLVLSLLRRLLPRAPPVALLSGALLFAAHPVHTEAVAWISAFAHPLTTAFALGAAHAQLSHARTNRRSDLVAAVLASAAALLTCEVALVLPVLLAALEWSGRRGRPSASTFVALGVPLVAVLWLRAHAFPDAAVPLRFGVAGAGRALTFAAAYVKDLVIPWPQRTYVSLPPGGVASAATWALALLALAGLGAVVARAPREERATPALAAAWSLLPLAPLAAAALNPNPLFAPRALYLPSVGLALLATWGVTHLPMGRTAWTNAALAITTAALLGACVVATAGWRDDLQVYSRVLDTDPELAVAHLRVGSILSLRGEPAAAQRHLEAAVRLAPDAAQRLDARQELGIHYGVVGRLDVAGALLGAVVAEDPTRAPAWVALGNIALVQQDLGRARDAYERALRIDPDHYEARYDLALALDAIGDAHGAAEIRQRLPAAGPQ
jgi:tetratricopeptide (TPR) repeat protein